MSANEITPGVADEITPGVFSPRLRIGISRCLLGDAVRHDSGHKRSPTLLAVLGPHVAWVAVCPEVEMGMGTPREPIQLVASADGAPSAGERVRLLGVTSRHDWTDAMCAWAPRRVAALQLLDLSGYIFKVGSPSCGLQGVSVYAPPAPPAPPALRGRGLFAQALLAAMPELPVADEQQLDNEAAAEAFLARARAYQERRG